MSRLAAVTATVLIASLTACAPHPLPPGIVNGTAEACTGTVLAPPRPVTVFVKQGVWIVAEQTISARGGGRFRLSLAPGRYVISASGSADAPHAVVLHSQQTITVDFPNRCP